MSADCSTPIPPAIIVPPLPFPFDRQFPIIPPPPPPPPPPPFFLYPFQHPCHCYHHHPDPYTHVPVFTTQELDESRIHESIPSTGDGEQEEWSALELGRGGEELDEEEEDVFVMTDEWVKFFAESDAKRRAEKKKQKKLRKGSK